MNAVVGIVFVFLSVHFGTCSYEPSSRTARSQLFNLALFAAGAAAGFIGFVYLYLHWSPEVLSLQFGEGEVLHLRITHVGDDSRTALRILPGVLGVVAALSPAVTGYLIARKLRPLAKGEDVAGAQ